MTRKDALIPDRRWIATVKFANGSRITTAIYGRNPSDAEVNYIKAHADVAALVIHHESIG